MDSSSVMKQFAIKPLFSIKIAFLEIFFTNSALFMGLAALFLVLVAYMLLREKRGNQTGLSLLAHISDANKPVLYSVNRSALIPTRFRASLEALYEILYNMLQEVAGKSGLLYFPFIFSLFVFILLCNLFGLLPGAFTVTSDIIVTFAMAGFIFVAATTIGFIKHGWGYFAILLPSGTPKILMPLMFLIEFFAYMSRPISLSLRLTANMIAGHIVLKVIASFVFIAGIGAIFPLALLTVLTGFELCIAILQAYIFTILACSYLNDALNLHH